MSYIVKTAPVSEPVSAADFRDFHLNVSDSTQESGIDELVAAVRAYIERQYDKAIFTQTIEEYYYSWEYCLDLTISPAVGITSVKYYNDDDTLILLDSSKYELISNRISAQLVFTDDMDYPGLSSSKTNAIVVEYVAGDSTVPAHIKQHIRNCVARMYYDKETFSMVMTNTELLFPEIRLQV